MLVREAEKCFQQGVQWLAEGRAKEALGYFARAIEIDRAEGNAGEVQARYLSYYGLCLGVARGAKAEALQHCREAVRREEYRAELWWNLGRVALICGERAEAHRALRRSLSIEPALVGARFDLRRMGLRRPPVLSFLDRGNVLNVLLGRLRRTA